MPDFSSYSLSIKWDCLWFSESLRKPMDVRKDNGTVRYVSGKDIKKNQSAQKLIAANIINTAAWISTTYEADTFLIEMYLQLGGRSSIRNISAPPHFSDGFSLSVVGDNNDPAFAGTKLLLFGTLKTGGRLIEYSLEKQPRLR